MKKNNKIHNISNPYEGKETSKKMLDTAGVKYRAYEITDKKIELSF